MDTEAMQETFKFGLTEKINDLIASYNVLMKLSVNDQDGIYSSGTLAIDNQDVLLFHNGRINIDSENKINVIIKCGNERIGEINAVMPLLKCGKKWMHVTKSIFTKNDSICNVELSNDNQEYILEDIRSLLSCII